MDALPTSIAYVRTRRKPDNGATGFDRYRCGRLAQGKPLRIPRDTVLTIVTAFFPVVDGAADHRLGLHQRGLDRRQPGGLHRARAGACWAFVEAKFGQFIYGRYPLEERWRVNLTGLLLIAGLVPIAIPSVPVQA
jgi:general L-amino acid transport system permease protein